MDLFNRPPAIAEDTLQYTIYPPQDLSDKTSVTTLAAYIRTFLDSHLPNFVWNRDAFEVKIIQNANSKGWILEGRMRVGDSVDDEWCTVWLLKEISSKWDVVISVFDSDGEFLLIEAAEALPAWVKPTNSENRVWIYNSRLHLVPISHVSPPSRKRQRRKLPGVTESDDEGTGGDDDDDWITPEDAIRLVRDPSVNTFAPSSVEKLVWARISGYPDAINSHTHTTKAYVPADIARALQVNPHLVQKAVETFYTRDAIQLRAAHRMSRFPPDTSTLIPVKLTRTAYAQLVGQKFFPPKVFERWEEKEGSTEWRRRDVGMKIAVGFEMLYQESKGRPSTSNPTAEGIRSSAIASKEALRRNPEYQKYLENLASTNYFKGEIQGSELWNSLENKAAAAFVEVRRHDDASRDSFAFQVDAAISEAAPLFEVDEQEEDNDDWLNIDAEHFENMLQNTMGSGKSRPAPESDAMDVDHSEKSESLEDRIASEQTDRLKELAGKVENFVEGEGDIEGARFEDEAFSDEEFSDGESSTSEEDREESTAERKAAMDKLVPGLEPSEYGKMPASFHSNSQRVAPTTIASDVIEEAKHEEDVQDAGSKLEPKVQSKPIRQPILTRDKYDGVDSDDETDEEEIEEDDESEEDKPQVVGDIEIDMGEEEEEFLEFSRQALGITDDQWNEIIEDRKGRGAFLPASATTKSTAATPKTSHPDSSTANLKTTGRKPAPGPRPEVNPNLDSFEAVMKALDEELARVRSNKAPFSVPSNPPASNVKGKRKASVEDMNEEENEVDIDAAMETELKTMLERGDGAEDEDEEPMDYNLIKNFLESFKSQAGLSGPVSNLASRLQPGWKLPRDET
ncbi:SGT1 protein-domain-containing protein [Crucibulum laeve]|uniref:SGT1 protein-domain-containing protein n=1 Tax=Crucibulum laeve TaxID=68775 RepID=A0A5C3MA24_9AGAR|nr:SGT1 protein-domain-containing protein [Crucibulum laeve]